LFGCATREEFCSYHPADLSPLQQPNGVDSASLAEHFIKTAMHKGNARFEWTHKRADNGRIFSADVQLSSMLLAGKLVLQATVRDISERKLMEEQARQLAFYDPLTLLPNRRLLNDRLGQTLSANKRKGQYSAVLFLDLDNFKSLNDVHGHVVGDLLLIDAATRLKHCVRETDTVARFGGDEFVILLSELATNEAESYSQASLIAEKVRTTLSQPYQLAINDDDNTDPLTVTHSCTASIGVIVFSNHAIKQVDILKFADAAMYQAKDAGRNQIRFYARPQTP
jgi:diguanylate cyclase (GGDEF)-like protein